MKQTLLLMTLTFGVYASPILVESYQEGSITIPEDESGEFTVTDLSFSLDTACYVQFAVGGMGKYVKLWLVLDGDSLPPYVPVIGSGEVAGPIPLSYTYLVAAGEHTLSLLLSNYNNRLSSSTCQDAYLQALIFLPDTGSAVAEQPTGDAEPHNTPSLVSKGPYVNVQGATELVDASGRIIEDAITDDKVYITNLPTGTYFARDGEQTVVKIVKVE